MGKEMAPPVPVLIGENLKVGRDGDVSNIPGIEVYPGVTVLTGDEVVTGPLLRVLAGVQVPQEGSVRWGPGFRHPVSADGFAARRTYVSAAPIRERHLRVADWLRLTAALWGMMHPARSIYAELARWGLAAYKGRRIGELSRGFERRLLLAGSLVPQPTFWCLEDPSAGLDHEGRLMLERMLAGGQDDAPATIIVTVKSPLILPLHQEIRVGSGGGRCRAQKPGSLE